MNRQEWATVVVTGWFLFLLEGCDSATVGTTKSYMEIGPRIISGRPTTIRRHRHLVYILNIGTTASEDTLHRGHGTLLTLKWVLTAAHLVARPGTEKIFVFAGVSRMSDLELDDAPNLQVQAVCLTVVHPLYRPSFRNQTHFYSHALNDIALLKLRGAFRKTQAVQVLGVDAIPYFETELNIFRQLKNRRCWVAGFGDVNDPGVLEDQLQEAEVSLVPSDHCHELGQIEAPTALSLCTHDDHSSAYKGDSGSPLICGGCFIGIVIAGKFNASTPKSERFSLYSRVDFWKGWILETMSENGV